MRKTARTLLKIEWESLLGFVQAAKFKDVGNSTWTEEGGQSVLLASPQQFANLLEAQAMQPGVGAELVDCLAGLPYVRLMDKEGKYLASSLDLPHRLASGHIAYNNALKRFRQQLQNEIEAVGLYQAVFSICPMSLLHGVFFSHFPVKDRITRTISGSIVGRGAVVAVMGMSVQDPVAADAETIEGLREHYAIGSGRPSTAGLGNIISHEAQYVCERIETKLSIDHRLIESYRLPREAERVMHLLALWKAAKLLNEPVRVRSGCDLMQIEVEALMGEEPQLEEVEAELKAGIAAAKRKGLLKEASELEFELPIALAKSDSVKKTKAKKAAAETQDVTADEEETV